MKRKLLSAFTALALCLSLLPGTAMADGTVTGVVTIIGTGESAVPFTLVDGGIYVADETNGVKKVEAVPESGVRWYPWKGQHSDKRT